MAPAETNRRGRPHREATDWQRAGMRLRPRPDAAQVLGAGVPELRPDDGEFGSGLLRSGDVSQWSRRCQLSGAAGMRGVWSRSGILRRLGPEVGCEGGAVGIRARLGLADITRMCVVDGDGVIVEADLFEVASVGEDAVVVV
jgi:hypothetical protein